MCGMAIPSLYKWRFLRKDGNLRDSEKGVCVTGSVYKDI